MKYHGTLYMLARVALASHPFATHAPPWQHLLIFYSSHTRAPHHGFINWLPYAATSTTTRRGAWEVERAAKVRYPLCIIRMRCVVTPVFDKCITRMHWRSHFVLVRSNYSFICVPTPSPRVPPCPPFGPLQLLPTVKATMWVGRREAAYPCTATATTSAATTHL